MKVAWWRSVRTRIAVTVALISMLVSGVVGFVLAERSASAAKEAVRGQALERLSLASDGYALDGKLRYGAVLDDSLAPASLRQELADPNVTREVTVYDGRRMWAGGRLGPHVVLTLGLDASDLEAQDRERLSALAAAAAVAALVSAVLGIAAGTTLSRRLRRAAVAATAIGRGDVAARAAQPGHDEIAQLTRAVDVMTDALQRRLVAEQEFTSDVAHELRTPLTGLVSAAELLPDDPSSDLVRLQVERLRRLVEDLLEISRLDRRDDCASLTRRDLGGQVRSSLARLDPDGSLRVEVLSSEEVALDERHLDRVLANLLANLRRHGGGHGTATVEGRRLTVRDEGPGYPDDIMRWGPRPFHAEGASKGSGLGLTIAMKHAEHLGARLYLSNRPEGGAQAELTFPPLSDDVSERGQ